MKIRVKHVKLGKLIFLSHLDMVLTVLRAIRRAEIPFSMTSGFSPKPKISYGLPLPVGAGSLSEYFDLKLKEYVPVSEIKERLIREFPSSLRVENIWEIDEKKPSVQAQVSAAKYYLWLKQREDSELHLEDIFQGEKWLFVDRKGREKDLKSLIIDLEPLGVRQGLFGLKLFAQAGSRGNLRPGDFCEWLSQKSEGKIQLPGRILRTELYYGEPKKDFLTPFSGG